MARFRKARKSHAKAKKRYSRSRGSGLIGSILSGAVIGAVAGIGAGPIRQYIPSVMGIRPESIAILGGGVAAKTLLHKGGSFSNAAVIIGSSMIVKDLLAGYPVGAGNGATTGAGVYG